MGRAVCRSCSAALPEGAVFCPACGRKQQRQKGVKKRGNGQGSVYRRGNTYTAIVTTTRGGERSRSKGGFPTRLAAQAHIHVLREELAQNAARRKISFTELYTKWSEKKFAGQLGRPIGESTKTAYRIAYKRCEPLYGFDDFRDVRYAEMQDVVDSLVSYDTQKDVKELLSQMSKFAMKYEWCEQNFAALLDLTNYTRPEKEAFTEDELAALWRDYLGIGCAPHPFTGFILIMAHCGLRYGELASIRKDGVFPDERYMMGGIKSALSRATPIAISEEILPVIREKYEKGRSKLLHMNEDSFYKAYYEACRRAGVRELTPHCCRHTYITRLTRAKVPPATIQKGARHASYQTTLQYTHMQIEDVLAAVNSTPRVVSELPCRTNPVL